MTRSEKSELQRAIEHNLDEDSALIPGPHGEWVRLEPRTGRQEAVVLEAEKQNRALLIDPRYKAWRETVPGIEAYQAAAARALVTRGVVDYRRNTAMGTVIDTIDYDEEEQPKRWNFKQGPIQLFPRLEIVNADNGKQETITVDALLSIANGDMLREEERPTKTYEWQPEGMGVVLYVEPSQLIKNAMHRLGIAHPERTVMEVPHSSGNEVSYTSFRSERIDDQLHYAEWLVDESEGKSMHGGSRVASRYKSIDDQMMALQQNIAKKFNQSADGTDVTWSRRRYVMHEMAEFDAEHEKLVRLLGQHGLRPAYFLAGYETGTVAPTVGMVNGHSRRFGYLAQDEDLHGAIFDAQHEFEKRVAR